MMGRGRERGVSSLVRRRRVPFPSFLPSFEAGDESKKALVILYKYPEDEEGIRRAKLSSSRSFFLSPPPLAPRFNGPSPLAGYGNEGKKRRGEGGRL